MFCIHCGAANPEAASFCSKCGKPIVRPADATAPVAAAPAAAQPVRYVMDVTPAAAPSPAAAAAIIAPPPPPAAPIARATPPAASGALTPAARAQFTDGLVAEVKRQIDDKTTPAGIAAFIFTVVIVARFTITWFGTQTGLIIAVVMGFVSAGIVIQIVKSVLGDKYLRPIGELSDEMLVSRYNEAKADRRAAATRNAISWAVIAIIGVLLVVAWVAAQRR